MLTLCTFSSSFLVCPQLRGPPDAALHEGLLSQYDGDSRSWQENYFILLGDFTLRWFESEEVNMLPQLLLQRL